MRLYTNLITMSRTYWLVTIAGVFTASGSDARQLRGRPLGDRLSPCGRPLSDLAALPLAENTRAMVLEPSRGHFPSGLETWYAGRPLA